MRLQHKYIYWSYQRRKPLHATTVEEHTAKISRAGVEGWGRGGGGGGWGRGSEGSVQGTFEGSPTRMMYLKHDI